MNGATQRLRVAGALLAWLRGRGTELAQCTQADLDVWFATPPSTHVHAIPFLRWAMAPRRAPKLELSRGRCGNARVLDQAERLDILRRLLDPSTGHLQHRVAAMMLVLLGQPFTRIAALSLSDVEVDADDVRVRLGDGVVPIPQPFAAMVTELIAGRPNLNTATNPTSPFVFPGRSADNHLLPSTLRTAAIQMGIDLLGARSGALRQLVLECPPAVVADALGYSYQVMDLHARRAGSPWSSLRGTADTGSPRPVQWANRLVSRCQDAAPHHSGDDQHHRRDRAVLHDGRRKRILSIDPADAVHDTSARSARTRSRKHDEEADQSTAHRPD